MLSNNSFFIVKLQLHFFLIISPLSLQIFQYNIPMNTKIIILFILSLIAGIAFFAIGFYFLSQKFLSKLNESSFDKSSESQTKNLFRSKGCGYTTLALGAITLIWGIFLFMFPALAPVLALIYMILLIAAFSVIMLLFK